MAMPQTVPLPLRGPFTVADYYRMAETGLLDRKARVELLDGLVVMMSPIGWRHAACVTRLNDLFAHVAPGRVSISPQNPVELDERSEPQPDLAILTYRRDGYLGKHPGPADILLCIEVMDTSAERDRRLKVPLYARAGVRELWLVDLPAGFIEVLREPSQEGYASLRRVARGELVTSHLLEDVTLSADDILD